MWGILYALVIEFAQEKKMAPLGKTKHNALSRKQEKAMRKAGKAKSRQASKKALKSY